MKNIFYRCSLVIIIFSCGHLIGQTISSQCCPKDTCRYISPCDTVGVHAIEKIISDTDGRVLHTVSTGPNALNLVTARTFNDYTAGKLAYYLTGTNDLSIYENYAVSNIGDGSLAIGHNFIRPAANNRIKYIATLGLQTNMANDFATIFEKQKFADETGATAKFTWLSSSKMKGYSNIHTAAMNTRRKQYYDIEKARQNQLQKICCSIEDIEAKNKFVTAENNAAVQKFYDYELEDLEEHPAGNGFNTFNVCWLSVQGYIPFSSKNYDVAPDTAYNFANKNSYNFSVTATGGWLHECKYGAMFVTADVKLFQYNSIEANDRMLSFYRNVAKLAPNNPNTYLSSDPADKAYVGAYQSFLGVYFKPKVVLFPKCLIWNDNKIGFSGFTEINFANNYHPINIVAGLPLYLKGQSADTPVNIEIQARWMDVGHVLHNSLSSGDRFSIGISVALPFGSVLQ